MPIRPRDQPEATRIDGVLTYYHTHTRPLPGIAPPARRAAFLNQLFESIHRIQYIERGVLRHGAQVRILDPRRMDPTSDLFDPIKAAALRTSQGAHDEACWLVFLFTHFGKNLRTGYRLARDVYGSLGHGPRWDWARTSTNPGAFRSWLTANRGTLQSGNPPRHFGNHRKYQSLDAASATGTGAAFASYVSWVLAYGTHSRLFAHAANAANQNRRQTFRLLYDSMRAVTSFGRTARFDYLTMIGKLNLAPIEPGSAYMTGATGPLEGARLLFGTPQATAGQLDGWLVGLEAALSVPMGMQVLEDALCNWQKSPDLFVPFRG